MMKKLPLAIMLFGFLGLLLGVNPAWSQTPCPGPIPCTFLESAAVPPTLPGGPATLITLVSCYDTFLGKPLGCGNVIHKVLGLNEPPSDLANNGGHQHAFETHPLIAPPPGDRLVFQNTGISFDPKLGVITGPVFGTAVILHQMPEVAGNIVTETLVRAPLGWRCFFNCFDSLHGRTLTTLDVAFGGLQELLATAEDPFVFKPRPSTEIHPNAHHGMERLHSGIRVISKTYLEKTKGRKPRITDMTLPAGGMFDLNGKWFVNKDEGNGHLSHRDGHDVDLSAEDSDGKSINCFLQDTDEMIKAFRKARAGFRECYDDGHYHVRFP
jgi:hypothetical protein